MLSVLTAVAPAHAQFLPSAYESLLAQDAHWEWLIQVDGPSMTLPLVADHRVRVASNGDRLGSSATRNRALLRARGSHVLSLDADDELLPSALDLLFACLKSRPELAYAIGETLDLFPDGQRIVRYARHPYEPGTLEPGRLESEWRAHGNTFLQPGSAVFRRDVVQACGGWAAIAGMEDQDLLFTVSTGHPGVYVTDATYLYRQHPGQTVRTAAFERDRELYRTWCDARVRALRALRGEDPALLVALEVPLPSQAEIDSFTTSKWKAALAAQLAQT